MSCHDTTFASPFCAVVKMEAEDDVERGPEKGGGRWGLSIVVTPSDCSGHSPEPPSPDTFDGRDRQIRRRAFFADTISPLPLSPTM
jgi:hypothetical protein